MNRHTQSAKEWLDRRYSRDGRGGYLAHQPIGGLHTERAEPNVILRFARTYRLLELLDSLEFETVLDVGGGEGYLAALVRDLFDGATTVHSSDLSAEACHRAHEIFDIRGAAADSTRLPFADGSYDLVLCSEVIEHLSRPVQAIAELARIARKYVVISTAEFCPAGEIERQLRSYTLDRSYPHAEVNWFTARDFQALLGNEVVLGAQYRNLEYLLPNLDWSRDQVERILTLMTASSTLDVDHAGVVVVCPRNGAAVPTGAHRSAGARRQQILNRLLEPPAPRIQDTRAAVDRVPDEALVRRLECLLCRGAVTRMADGDGLICRGCGQSYDVSNGVPRMFAGALDDPHRRTLEEECVARLADGDPDRARAVRETIGRLHDNESRRNSVWTQRCAEQLLRVLWLWHRDEPLKAKVGRLVGRLAGSAPAGSEEIRSALFTTEGSGPKTVDQARYESISRV